MNQFEYELERDKVILAHKQKESEIKATIASLRLRCNDLDMQKKALESEIQENMCHLDVVANSLKEELISLKEEFIASQEETNV